MSDASNQQSTSSRPLAPTTVGQLRKSLQLIRVAIGFSIVAIALMTWVFVAYLDAPTVPLVPIAALVVLVDLGMLIAFTRQRNRAIAKLEEGHTGLS